MIVVNTVTEEAFRQIKGNEYIGIKSGKIITIDSIDGFLIKMALDDLSIVEPRSYELVSNDTIYEPSVRYEFDRIVEVQKFNGDGELTFENYYGLKRVVLVPVEFSETAMINTTSKVNNTLNIHYKVNERGDVFKFNCGSGKLTFNEDGISIFI